MAPGASSMVVASLAVTMIAAVAAGCGGNSAVVSCALSQNGGSLGVLKICLEAPASTFSQGCPAPTAAGVEVSVMDGPCSRIGAVGGCRITSGAVSETVWYYTDGLDAGSGPMTSDIQMLCAEGGATFVAP